MTYEKDIDIHHSIYNYKFAFIFTKKHFNIWRHKQLFHYGRGCKRKCGIVRC